MTAPSSQSALGRTRNGALVAAGCFLLLALGTIGAWWRVRATIERAARLRLQAYEQLVRGASAFVAVDTELARADWLRYVQQRDLPRQFPGIRALAY